MSAGSFSFIFGIFVPIIFLGFVLIKSIIFDNSSLSFNTVLIIGNTVSNLSSTVDIKNAVDKADRREVRKKKMLERQNKKTENEN